MTAPREVMCRTAGERDRGARRSSDRRASRRGRSSRVVG
jgi:hypothetical protein